MKLSLILAKIITQYHKNLIYINKKRFGNYPIAKRAQNSDFPSFWPADSSSQAWTRRVHHELGKFIYGLGKFSPQKP